MKKAEKIRSQIDRLEEKYRDSGQDLGSYLDGLLYQRYLTYWDYIHLDTLLSLQVPRTHYPDEEVFIMYHQITELHFKLIIHEQRQLVEDSSGNLDFFIERLRRINSYFQALINSFGIMIKGMEREQFMRYRMALLPASGFQSAQYRMIELYATPLENLLHPGLRGIDSASDSLEDRFDRMYWKQGATDRITGEKTLTLKQFEQRYTPRFLRIAKEVGGRTIYDKYLKLPEGDRYNELLIKTLRELDLNANVNWPLMHLGSAYRYLHRENREVESTGGTNWKEFLPPSFQKVIFFPTLYTEEEREQWGKQWVDHILNPTSVEYKEYSQ